MAQADLSLGRASEAIPLFNQALPCFHASQDSHREAQTLMGLGSAQTQVGNYTQAAAAFQKAMTVYQSDNDKSGAAAAKRALDKVSSHLPPQKP